MSSNHHDPIPYGAPAAAATINGPLGQLDAAIARVIATGSGASTTLTAQANAGSSGPFTVASTSGFLPGDVVFFGEAGGTHESRVVNTVPTGTTFTTTANLTGTYAIGKTVSKSPVELVDARGTYSSLGGRLAAIDGRVYDVKRYGAKGDGVTDDTAAILAAIAAAAAVGGGIVFVPYGQFVISATLVLSGGVSLVGTGRGSVLFLKAASNCSMLRIPVIRAQYYGITLQQVRDIELDGNKANQGAGNWYGIELPTAAPTENTQLLFENVWVQFTKGSAWHVELGRDASTFIACEGIGSGTYGFEILSAGNHLFNCYAGECDTALFINNWSTRVYGGGFFAAASYGIRLGTSSRYTLLHGSGADRNDQRGLLIEGEYNQVIGCTFLWNSKSAADTYPHIEIGSPKVGNVVRDCVFVNQGTRASAGLKVVAGSPGIYGPNLLEPGSALIEAESPYPVRFSVRPRASVHRNGVNLSIPNGGSPTAVPFTHVRENTHGLWSAGAPSRFVIPALRGLSGRYRAEAVLKYATNATGVRVGQLSTVAAIIRQTAVPAVAGQETIIPVGGEIYLNDGDVVELAAYQTSGGALNIVASPDYGCEFTITRLED